jgi:predicted nucleic acid-binding protein
VILADTSIWIDHFRCGNPELDRQLVRLNIVMHPFIVAELTLGLLPQRSTTLAALDQLPGARVARLDEVRLMIERHSLYGRGIGLTDAHLVASALLTPCRLWTQEKRLREVAKSLDAHVSFP